MRSLFRPLVAAVLAVACMAVTACVSPPPVPAVGGRSVAARGGDAESDLISTDTQIPFAQPGGTAVASTVRNEDRVQSTNGAPTFALNLAADGAAVQAAIRSDPVVASFAAELKLWGARLEKAETPEARGEARAGLDAARAQLTAHVRSQLEAASGLAPQLDHLEVLVYAPVYVQSAGESIQKLDADAIRAGSESIAKAVEVAVNATK